MKRLSTNLIIIALFLVAHLSTTAQDKNLLDSLTSALENDLTDRERVDTYNELGNLYRNVDFSQIAQYTQPAIALAKEINYPEGLADAYYLNGGIYIWKGEYDSTLLLLDSAMYFAEKVDYKKGKANAYNGMGFIARLRSQYDSSLYFNKKALSLREEISDYEGVAASLHSISLIYLDTGEPDTSFEFANKSLEISIQHGLEDMQIYALNSISEYHLLKGNIEEALEASTKSLEIASTYNKLQQIGDGNINVGKIYQNTGDYVQALDYFQKGLKIYEQAEILEGQAVSHENIGFIQFFMGDAKSAIASIKKNLAINLQLGNIKNAISGYNNVGYLLGLQGEYVESFNHLDEGLKLAKELNSKEDLALLYGSYSEIYLEQENLPKTIEYHEKAIRTYREMGAKNAVAERLITSARYYIGLKNYDAALKSLDESISIAEEIDSKLWIRNASKLKSEVYAKLGRGMQAYNAHVRYHAMADSIFDAEKTRTFARMEADFEFAKEKDSLTFAQEAERLALNSEIERKSASQRTTLFGLGVAVVILVMLILFLRQNKKANKQLSELNVQIQNQNAEIKSQRDHLEDLNHMKNKFFSIVSHDLRGPMSSFQSLSEIMQFSLENNNHEELTSVTQEVVKQSKQVSLLLDNLLNWAVNDEGQIPYQPEEVNLSKEVNEILKIYRPLAQFKNIDLRSDIDAKQLLWVDKNSFSTILRNILSNAIKFTPDKGEIVISSVERDEAVSIRISDSGVGMQSEKLRKLFVLNESDSTEGTSGEKGVGLGLQLVNEFVKLNKGSIEVESQEKQGTIFDITFPSKMSLSRKTQQA